ncbi:MAG: hypothetical protein GX676_02355 [Bacilli bacterium]|nr:hypothetical protein [Bacilli bacterium]
MEPPTNIRYNDETKTVSWDSVPNSDGYIVKINGEEKGKVNDINYVVSFEESTNFKFSVKALGRSLYSTDSEYSAEQTFYYTAPQGQNYYKKHQKPMNVYVDSDFIFGIQWKQLMYIQYQLMMITHMKLGKQSV